MSALLQLAMPILRRIVVALAIARLEAAVRRATGRQPRSGSAEAMPAESEPPTVPGIRKPPYGDNGA